MSFIPIDSDVSRETSKHILCTDCPRMCGAPRSEVSGSGFCGMGTLPVIARAALHFDEEPVISGRRGSGAIFFSGCSLRCCYCQNYPVSHDGFGQMVSVERLREIYSELIGQGAHNINLVNPTHFTGSILRSLEKALPVPVVWNSSGYERVDTLRKLEGRIQVYLPDLKYMDEGPARRYSGASDYFQAASQTILEMYRQTGPVKLDREGMVESGLIIRHLILPGRARESCRILDWIAENVPEAWISLMAQYMPYGDVRGKDELERPITQEEYDLVFDHLSFLGLENGFIQDLSASDESYIPAFDLTGVNRKA